MLVIAALTTLMLHVGQPGQLWWWAAAIPFWLWIAGPTWATYYLARRNPVPVYVWPLAGFLLIATLVSALIYHDAFFRSSSSTAALVLLFIPLYCWIGLGLTWALALALKRIVT